MEPNTKQHVIIKSIIGTLNALVETEDIDSSKNIEFIEGWTENDLEDIIDNPKLLGTLIDKIKDIFWIIQSIK